MRLEVDTSKFNTLTKFDKSSATEVITNNSVSIFDKINEHKTETIIGGVAAAGLIGLSILARKKIPKSLSSELLQSWATSTEPLTKKEVKLAKKELEKFVEGLQLNTIREKVKVKLVDTSGFCGGSTDPISNHAIIDKTILTDTKMIKVVGVDGKIRCWEICGEGTNTFYPMITKLEELPLELQQCAKPLTKLERLNYAKSLAAHEAFHLSQFRRMLLHPDIGKEKLIELMKAQNPTLTNEQIQRVINNKNINIFKRLLFRIYPNFPNVANKINIASSKYYWKDIAKEKNLNPASDIGKETMKEYSAHKHFLCNTPTDPNEYFQAYVKDLFEIEAYRFQSKIIKDHNLLS